MSSRAWPSRRCGARRRRFRRPTCGFGSAPCTVAPAGLTGRIDEFVSTAKQLADSARDIPGLAYANLAFLLGNAELVRGAVADAARLLHEALAGVERHAITTGLRPASYFALAEAHAKLGQPSRGE